MKGLPPAKKKPVELVREALAGDADLSADLLASLPRKWHLIGHVMLLQGVDPRIVALEMPVLRRLGEAYLGLAQLSKEARTVALETETPHGELRTPRVVVIAGDATSTDVVHVEGGVRYCFDPTRVMFSSGNINERMWFRNHVEARGQVVVDMFAGIGYFTVPLARSINGAPAVIYAMELNPDSASYLARTARANKVSHIVHILQGDNRDCYVSQCANRVIMGYIPTPVQFIERALSFLCAAGGIVHYHFTATEDAKETMPMEHFQQQASEHYQFALLSVRLIKSYAPRLYHYCADMKCVPKNHAH